MTKTLLRILIVVVICIALGIPVLNHFEKVRLARQLDTQEQQLLGPQKTDNPLVKEIQQVLTDLTLYSGPIDGNLEESTRVSIRNFQKAQGLPVTGKMDPSTYDILNKQKYANAPVGENPTNASAEGVTEAAAVNTAVSGGGTEQNTPVVPLDSNNRNIDIQTALKNAGFYQGEIDGKIGPKTKKSIVEFQTSKSLKADGVVGPKTWQALSTFLSATNSNTNSSTNTNNN